MSKEIVKQEQQGMITFTPEQVALIKSQIAPKATDDELKLFLYQAQRTGLDPLAKQIYCIHRYQDGGEKMTIQTAIDGFRVVADRHGDYGGQDAPEYVHGKDGQLLAAKVKVYKFRNEQRYLAAEGFALFNEYCQRKKDGAPMAMWGKMPYTMLAKCAEAQALRKAYPQDLSGIYTADEMAQADEPQDISHEEIKMPVLNSNHPQYNYTVQARKNGTEWDVIRKAFTVSKEVEEEIENLVNQPA